MITRASLKYMYLDKPFFSRFTEAGGGGGGLDALTAGAKIYQTLSIVNINSECPSLCSARACIRRACA